MEIPLNEEGHRHPHLRSKSDEEEAMAKHRMDLTTFVGKIPRSSSCGSKHHRPSMPGRIVCLSLLPHPP